MKKICIHNSKILLLLLSVYLCTSSLGQTYRITFKNTIAVPPTTPFIKDYINQGRVSSVITNGDSSYPMQVYLFGIIKRISPSPFSITLKKTVPPPPFQLNNNTSLPLSISQILDAFGNFSDLNNFDLDQTTLAAITDPNNSGVMKLPDGTYSICFFTRSDVGCGSGPNECFSSDPNLGCSNIFTIISCTQPQNGMLINTMVKPPINPLIAQSISAGSVISNLQFSNPPGCSTRVKLFGRIERLSPSPIKIELNPNYQQQASITINPGLTQISPAQMIDAFSNFNESNLVVSGVDLASIKDANNRIKLPDGNYRICFYARYVNGNGGLGDYASDPNLGCASFTICNQAGGAPQFTQPVNNLNINSEITIIQPVSPVVFTWTPPQSTCGLSLGGFSYDFEIRELFPNQTVTDAINNPFVFRKTSLPSTTFLLDVNLYKNVLEPGKRYAIRVRAISNNVISPVEIDNDGYSRIEAFQYGGSVIPQNGVPDPHDYYIPFEERKSGYWIDVYQRSRQKDTLVPIKEYIAFALTQNGIAYSLDGIELLLALNPELVEVKHVKINYALKLPVFPPVSSNDQKSLDKEHAANLEPDRVENDKFLKYLDTLNTYKKIPDKAVRLISDLASHLNNVKVQISSIDRVTVQFINSILSKLLYELRLYSRNLNTSQYNQLQQLATGIRELTAESSNTASLFYKPLFKSHAAGPNGYTSQSDNEIESPAYIPVAIEEQLLPFDVIVWRTGTVAPYKPVLDAPDLKASFRVFYILSKLYNHKNPEVNATSSSRLASTIRVSLPSNTTFSIWTLNMLNHRTTGAKDVDLRDVFKNSMKNEPRLKRPSIVIKVD